MQDIKLTSKNYQSIIEDMLNNIGDSQINTYYFSVTDINESTIRQTAWDNNILVTISPVDGFISKISFSKILN